MTSVTLPSASKRSRILITPEGLALPLTVASRGVRFGAIVIDLAILTIAMLVLVLGALWLGFGSGMMNAGGEFVTIIVILAVFVLRNFYFAFFELGPRGATPGKRAVGIRIADRDGGRLTAEAVIARNLLREIELFVPLYLLLGLTGSSGLVQVAALGWFAIFALFFCFNRDRMRAGDIVAGTWVVEADRRRLGDVIGVEARYDFGEAELSVYGEYELQVLEGVLREDRPQALAAVATRIADKIGWGVAEGDERAFLEAFYTQQREWLERGMRMGRRRADKHETAG